MMNNEDFERKVEFIVNQQAQFAADIQQLQETQKRMQETQAQTERSLVHLADITLEGFKNVNIEIRALVDSQIRTDEGLRNLIAVVDRHISEGRNGV